jgi:hypothetical protein
MFLCVRLATDTFAPSFREVLGDADAEGDAGRATQDESCFPVRSIRSVMVSALSRRSTAASP